MEDNEDLAINELTEKLKDQMSSVDSTYKGYREEEDLLKKENLETFLLEKTGILVNEGLSTIRELKDAFVNNPDAEEIDALSQAFKAVSSALSVLKDIQVTTMKNDSNKQLKEMDIKAKKELKEASKEDDTQKVLLTRDEVFTKLLKDSSVIDAEFKKEDLD
jgi:hypothetical protein